MILGIGIPVSGQVHPAEWARKVEAADLNSISVTDRLRYAGNESLITLATCAVASQRLRLRTQVLVTPVRETAVMVKQTTTLHRLSGGRLEVGVGAGARKDDFLATGRDFHSRGSTLSKQISALKVAGQATPGTGSLSVGPPVLVGGHSQAALVRGAQLADGYICSAMPDYAHKLFAQFLTHWSEAGRQGAPIQIAQINVAVGDERSISNAQDNFRDYYKFLPTELLNGLDNQLLCNINSIEVALDAYRHIGFDEVTVNTWVDDPDAVLEVVTALSSSAAATAVQQHSSGSPPRPGKLREGTIKQEGRS